MSTISDLLTVLAHEMRTPIAAILGYQELIIEGIYGDVDERGKEPLDRIAYSARQLLHLIDGVQEITMPPNKRLSSHSEEFQPTPLLRACLAHAHADAIGRNVVLSAAVPDDLPRLHGDPERFCRAIDLAVAAAIKSSYGATLQVSAGVNAGQLQVTIEQTALSLERDDPGFVLHEQDRLTGSGLRLAIVREIASQMHGGLDLTPTPDGTLTVSVRFSGNSAVPKTH
jgi:signal transduction histidine kinase